MKTYELQLNNNKGTETVTNVGRFVMDYSRTNFYNDDDELIFSIPSHAYQTMRLVTITPKTVGTITVVIEKLDNGQVDYKFNTDNLSSEEAEMLLNETMEIVEAKKNDNK